MVITRYVNGSRTEEKQLSEFMLVKNEIYSAVHAALEREQSRKK